MPHSSTAKSSARSSRSSLQSVVSTSSLPKAIGRGIKRIKKGASAITRPLKRAKHVLSNVSSPAVSDAENDPAAGEDQESMKTDELVEVIDLDSDSELNDLEKELGTHPCHSFLAIFLTSFSVAAQQTWRSPIYSFFKPKVTIEVHHGRVAHFFACSAKKCKTEARGIRRYQDKGDKSSTANLRHHVIRCFGEDSVNAAMKGESDVSRSGNIFSAFARQGKRPATYSHRAHSTPEFR